MKFSQLGKHQLIEGSIEEALTIINPNDVGCLYTDPPVELGWWPLANVFKRFDVPLFIIRSTLGNNHPEDAVNEDGSVNYHPSAQPISKVMEILKFSDGTILDPFAGSGSTLFAAERLGRKCIAVEIDPKLCEIIVHRYNSGAMLLE